MNVDETTTNPIHSPLPPIPNPLISLLTPSRGRPNDLADMMHSAISTASDPSAIEFCVVVDTDDPTWSAYISVISAQPNIRYADGSTTMSDLWNHAFAISTGSILMVCADDLRFRTVGWDALVRTALSYYPDEIVLVYGSDGIADQRMATHPFVPRRWAEVIGRFSPPYFVSDYVDLWMHEVAKGINRDVYLPDLFIEHMHPSVGKGEYDQTHLDRMQRAEIHKPHETWVSTADERAAEIEKLRAAMVEAETP